VVVMNRIDKDNYYLTNYEKI